MSTRPCQFSQLNLLDMPWSERYWTGQYLEVFVSSFITAEQTGHGKLRINIHRIGWSY